MFPFVLLVQCFYDGLTRLTQATIDNACGGAIREKTAKEVYTVYEMLGENSQQRSRRNGAHEEKAETELAMQLADLSWDMENLMAHRRQQPVVGEVQSVYSHQHYNH